MNLEPLYGKIVTLVIPDFTPVANPAILIPYTLTGHLSESECSTVSCPCAKVTTPEPTLTNKDLRAAYVTQPTHIPWEIVKAALELVNLPKPKAPDNSQSEQSKLKNPIPPQNP